MIGSLEDIRGKAVCWAKLVTVTNIEQPKYGHVYQLKDDAFIPCEFRKGVLDEKYLQVSRAFFKNFMGPSCRDLAWHTRSTPKRRGYRVVNH